jgi:tol-pal system protein YbgF
MNLWPNRFIPSSRAKNAARTVAFWLSCAALAGIAVLAWSANLTRLAQPDRTLVQKVNATSDDSNRQGHRYDIVERVDTVDRKSITTDRSGTVRMTDNSSFSPGLWPEIQAPAGELLNRAWRVVSQPFTHQRVSVFTNDMRPRYDEAMVLLTRGKKREAQLAFKTFVETYSDERLSGNAHFWIGDIALEESDFKEAAVAFSQVLKRFPLNSKAPDAMLKLGISLQALNANKEACTTFRAIRARYPAASDDVMKLAAARYAQLKCGD